VVDTEWDKKVWNDSWQSEHLGDKLETELTKSGLLPSDKCQNEQKGEKRRQPSQHQRKGKRARLDPDTLELLRDDQSPRVAAFLMSSPNLAVPKNKSRQMRMSPLSGLEWQCRKLLYNLADTALSMATLREELKNFLPSLAIGVDEWEELPLAETIVTTANTEEEKVSIAILDELVKTTPKPVAVKPGKRGRKKKVLVASKDDREITSFFSKTVNPSGGTCYTADGVEKIDEKTMYEKWMREPVSECATTQPCGDIGNAEMGTELNNWPVLESNKAIHAQEITNFSDLTTNCKNASTGASVTSKSKSTLPLTKKLGISEICDNKHQNGGIIPDIINWVGRSEGDYGVRSMKRRLVETKDSGGN
jgi:hypothetical protein